MKENQASKTAQYMALFRAIESHRSQNSRLFKDPFADLFLDPTLKFVAKASHWPLFGTFLLHFIQHKGPGALSSGIARTKLIDDLLQKTILDGAKQVIILGAGFDTRALRLKFLNKIPVIEIDHPNTSKLKQERLNQKFQSIPSNIRYLQIDFNAQKITDFANQIQLDRNVPTTIIWEGVTNYLTEETITQSFDLFRQFPRGSCLIFTYIHKDVLEHPELYHGTQKIMADLHKNQEIWTFGFDPQELPTFLSTYGYKLIEDKNAVEYRSQYLKNSPYLLSGYEFYRVSLAIKET